jgi:hypothetical protein
MATVLEYTTEELGSVGRFYWVGKGINAKDINKEMFPVYAINFVA